MTLPVELTEARLDALREKRASIRERFDSVQFDTAITGTIFESVDEGFERAETRRSEFISSYEQNPSSEATQELYKRCLRSIDGLASQLNVLQGESLYLELHEHQRSDDRCEALDRAKSVCQELRSAFDISPTVFPVINDGYSTTPLGGELPSTGKRDRSEVYIPDLPRESNTEQYEPLLMHELGHVLFDDHPTLRGEARSLARERADTKDGVDDLDITWYPWFKELFCDVCGVLGYGPAYVCALLRRLTRFDPFGFDTGHGAGHPPNALRFEVVRELADREFSDLVDAVKPDVTEFEDHLAAFEGGDAADYEAYDDDRLFRFVVEEVPEAVGGDLDLLVDDITEGVEPSTSSERRYRLEANRRLLPSYPPQKGG